MSQEARDQFRGFHTREETELSRIMVVALDEHVCGTVDGEAVILHLSTGGYYGLNSAGTRVWNMIQSPTAVSAIRDALVAEYDVEPSLCERDLIGLLEDLLDRGLIRLSQESDG